MSRFTTFVKSVWNSRSFLKGASWGLLLAAMVVGALLTLAVVYLAMVYRPEIFSGLAHNTLPFACVDKNCSNWITHVVTKIPKEFPLP